MATQFTGGCLCGAVRYECSADPFFMGNCHCRDCQKASGGAYEPDIGLPAAALKITVRLNITTVKQTAVIR
jgi:hypothetical protein